MHLCNERRVYYFLEDKSEYPEDPYSFFIGDYLKIGEFVLHPAISHIAFAAKIRFGYIHRIGQDFLDMVLTFPKSFEDNLCFYRIGEVPRGKYYQTLLANFLHG